jgi:RNA polymerase sigma-70 factor, ECF subfamily
MARGSPRPEQGRGEWLSELYQAHARPVEGYCRRFLNNPEDAADATHEVFLRALSSLEAPPASRQARGWLITVAQNYCLDLLRRQRRMQTAVATLGADATRETGSEAEVLNRQLLLTVLEQLGERERQALYQSAVEQRTLTEIAGYLGVSYMAAAQVLHRARKHASAVAAKLAAILGLAAANSMRRRSPGLTVAQSLAAVAVMPLVVIAIATPSSSAQGPDAERIANHGTPAVAAQRLQSAVASSLTDMMPDQELVPGYRRHLVRNLVAGPAESTLAPALAEIHQAVEQVTGSLPTPSLPAQSSLPTPPSVPLLSPLPTPSLPKPSDSIQI